jgi:glycosyltransferase involved in cell wall biosynthesis
VAAAVAPDAKVAEASGGAVDWLRLPSASSWRRLAGGLAALAREWRADVCHATYIAPFRLPCVAAVSVHDVSFRRFPEFFSTRDRLLFAAMLPGSLKRADAILTLSQHTAREINTFYPGHERKTHVVPAAQDRIFRPVDAEVADAVIARCAVRRPFLLAVGSIQPRKNLTRLIEAYDGLRRTRPEVQLVIVGPGGFRESAVRDAIVNRQLSDSVKWLGYVPDDDLVGLYNAAVALVYPSVYEGFGLPVVEAMACGCPVIAANTSSLPEVAGDAALLVDPFQVSSLQDAMQRLVSDDALRAMLRTRALAHVIRFSWRKSAEAAVAAYGAASGAHAI